MGHDPFLDKIIYGLKGKLNPDIFEDCAVDLLKDEFPGIAPIPGGSDSGRDGAIPDGEGEAFPLICTTGKGVIRNLSSSLKSYLKEGGPRRKVVLATSQFLSEKRRHNLEVRARKLGFTLVQIIDGQGMAHRIYHRPEWCKRLLELTGYPPALSVYPSSTRPLLNQTIIGRDEDISWLESRTSDSIVVGQPGSGKTFLLYSLCKKEWGLFLVDDDMGRIADAVRSQKPKVIILDDAHVKQDLLEKLLQLRRETQAEFIIIATCWPGSSDEIMHLMNFTSQDTKSLDLIDRNTMVKVVSEAGIVGPNILVREIVTQAQGKPGLAVTLVDLCIKGGVREVIHGEALSRYIRQFFEKIEGKGIADILATFSLGGDWGMSPEVIADYFKISISELRRKLAALHAGGVIQELRNKNICVQPAVLRYSLIKDVFFQGPCSLSYEDFQEHIPIHKLVLSLIGAKSAGAKIEDEKIKELFSQIKEKEVWGAFAELGPKETSFVLNERPDLIVEVAPAALHHNPQQTIVLLLENAIHDPREILSHLDQPLRKIHDWIMNAFHDEDEAIRRRKLLLKTLEKWFADGKDPVVGIHALTFLFMPFLEKVETDPGLGRTITIHTRYLSVESIRKLSEIWKKTFEIINQIDIFLWRHLFSMLHDLVYPDLSRVQVPKEVYEAYRKLAIDIIIDLSALAKTHPGVISKLTELADNLDIRIPQIPDKIFSTLYPQETKRVDFHKNFEGLVKKAKELAIAMKDISPEEVVEEIYRVEQEAERANITWPRLTNVFCRVLAQKTEDPSKWIDLLFAHDCKADLVEPFIVRCEGLQDKRFEELISQCLDTRQYRLTALSVVLEHPQVSEGVLQMALDIAPEYAESIKYLVYARFLSNEVLELLLSHPDDRIAEAVAIGMWEAEPEGVIEERLYEHWRKAFLRAKEKEYWIVKIIQSNQQLAFDWLSARLNEHSRHRVFDDDEIKKVTELLTYEQRLALIKEIREDILVKGYMVEYIVGNDLVVYRYLVSRTDLKRYHLSPLHGSPTSDWQERAKIAMAAGYLPEDIVRAAIGSYWGGFGRESEMWKQWIDHAKMLMDSDDVNIQALGKAMLERAEREHERELANERKEDMYGRY